MNKERIKQHILDSRERMRSTSYFIRDLKPDYGFLEETGKIAAIVGPRRAGKSVFLLQIAADTLTPPGQCVWIDFGEIAWSGFGVDDWETLWLAALETGSGQRPLFLLDEIQELDTFEGGLKYLQNRGGRVFITGSNAEVFEERLSAQLRGKLLSYRLYPLSFAEFLRFRGIDFPAGLSSSLRAKRSVLMEEYLCWGGFPEVVLAERDDLKRNLLSSYWDVMLFRDIVERHGLKNFSLLQGLLRKVLLSFTKEGSVHRWYNDFRSQGFKVGKDSLYEYLDYFQKALFVYPLANAAVDGGSRKYYLVDNGLYQMVKDRPDLGKLWENQCLVDLLRNGEHPRFWKTASGEIDFVTNKELIQVTVELTDENRSRELAPFELAKHSFPAHGTRILELPR